MTLIDYLTRTHFAEAAIEDALPEEVGVLARALVLLTPSREARPFARACRRH